MIARAREMTVAEGLKVGVAQPYDLIAMKVLAGDPRDLDDARRLIQLFPDMDRELVRQLVNGFAESLERPNLNDRLSLLFEEAEGPQRGAQP